MLTPGLKGKKEKEKEKELVLISKEPENKDINDSKGQFKNKGEYQESWKAFSLFRLVNPFSLCN